ncbi:alpha/beta hydrolase [Flavobacterium sp. HJJ]|uniref:alpha/beta hydrolase n=1 Tax=Flavobacterium sp. HJJ TaxID=2783792 RepID=UPI00188D9348|nr:alpha/beta hydrolase [Flavobacterium sp. HJJ]MBF4473648.1 alpha/beta hydrolase [Flavobacterium sp. HJJ]
MTAKKQTIKKVLKTIWITAGIVFTLWVFYSSQSQGVSNQSLKESPAIKIQNTDDYYCFTPKAAFKNVFIFYPGAMVDPKAYVPLCRKIAENSIKVYLIKMPWRLASKGYNKPKELHLLCDTNKTYILSGHSLGAKMAAQFVFENPELIDKLILIGTTHPKTFSLADCKIPVLKIYGSKDGVADEKSIWDNRSKLPKTAKFQRIEGGNHSQFGYYGFQLGDNKATISREKQQAETLKIIMDFINE